MSPKYEPSNPIEGGRVYKRLSLDELEERARDGPSGYQIANDFRKQVNLSDAAWRELAISNIDAIGFEVEVVATARDSSVFDEVQGMIGLSLMWLTNPVQVESHGPHLYLFAKYREEKVEPLNSDPAHLTDEREGCLFVAKANFDGSGQNTTTPATWENALSTIGAFAGISEKSALLSGELSWFTLNLEQNIILMLNDNMKFLSELWSSFGTKLRYRLGNKGPYQVVLSTYLYDQWLLERFGILEQSAESSWTPPGDHFRQTTEELEWEAKQIRMSLVLSALVEEHKWLKNDSARDKYEEHEGSDQLKLLKNYYSETYKRRKQGGHSFTSGKDPNKDDSRYRLDKDCKKIGSPVPKKVYEWASLDRDAWSAVFISYVAAQADIAKSDGFAFSARHLSYIVLALKNRLNEEEGNMFRLYATRTNEEVFEPKIGDILCKNRHSKSTNIWSVDKLRQEKFLGDAPPYVIKNANGASHTDIVVRIEETPDDDMFLETIGGNTYDYLGMSPTESGNGTNVGMLDTAGRKRWKKKTYEEGNVTYDWVMVGSDDKEIGQGSESPSKLWDPSEPCDKDKRPTVWDRQKDSVFGFMRYDNGI